MLHDLRLRPSWIVLESVGTGKFYWHGERIPYTIMRKEAGPEELPGFLGYFEGEERGGKKSRHLFISEDSPVRFRRLQLIHELIEFDELADQPDRCLRALERELDSINDPTIYADYVEYRLNFFENLVKYYENYSNTEFLVRIRQSRDLLREL